MAMITTQMLTNAEETKKGTIFRMLDLDADGAIAKEELEKILIDDNRGTAEDVEQIMHNFDNNRNGNITYTEFLTGSID